MKIYNVVIALLSGMIYASQNEIESNLPLSFGIAQVYVHTSQEYNFIHYKAACTSLLEKTEYTALVVANYDGRRHVAGPYSVIERIIICAAMRRTHKNEELRSNHFTAHEKEILNLTVGSDLFQGCRVLEVYNQREIQAIKDALERKKDSNE